MKIFTTHYVLDHELEMIGLVKGMAPASNDTVTLAIDHMIKEASTLKADAIVSVKFSTLPTSTGQLQTLVYGTAVKYKVSTGLQQF